MPHPPKALIFDCDGTLILSAELHYQALSSAFAAQGHQLDRDFYFARTGLSRRALLASWIEFTGKTPNSNQLVEDSVRLAKILALAGQFRTNSDIVDLARAWRPRPSAVASNGEAGLVLAMLKTAGIDSLFDTVVTIDQVGLPKPDPAMFLLAAARLEVSPADCLVLEDSAQGLEAAERAGMAAIDIRAPQALSRIEALLACSTIQ